MTGAPPPPAEEPRGPDLLARLLGQLPPEGASDGDRQVAASPELQREMDRLRLLVEGARVEGELEPSPGSLARILETVRLRSEGV